MTILKEVVLLVSIYASGVSCVRPNQAARLGYTVAVTCYPPSRIPFAEITRHVVHSKLIISKIGDSTFLLRAFGQPINKEIYVLNAFRDNHLVWAHEYLHVESGVSNHPDSLFARCGL